MSGLDTALLIVGIVAWSTVVVLLVWRAKVVRDIRRLRDLARSALADWKRRGR